MTGLLEIRESLKNFYVKNEIYLNPLIKFLVALISLGIINGSMGYMKLLTHITVVLVISLICSLLPKNFIVIAAAFYIIVHSYALALECAIVMLAVLMIMFLLYFRFSPKDTLVVLLVPLFCMLRIPFVMPVVLGLVSGPASIVSLSCGTVVYYIIKFMSDNIGIFSASDAQTGSQKFRVMMDGILDNKTMLIAVIVFALTLVIVYTLRKSSMDHSWTIAIFTGIAVSVVLFLVCEFLFELQISVIATVIGGIVSLILAMVVEFFEFNLDYNRTEIVQFEDDEYYYYVKAVPKNVIMAPEKTVKRINKQQKNRVVRPSQKHTVPRASMAGKANISGKAIEKSIKEKGQNTKTIKTANGVARSTVSGQNMEKK